MGFGLKQKRVILFTVASLLMYHQQSQRWGLQSTSVLMSLSCILPQHVGKLFCKWLLLKSIPRFKITLSSLSPFLFSLCSAWFGFPGALCPGKMNICHYALFEVDFKFLHIFCLQSNTLSILKVTTI